MRIGIDLGGTKIEIVALDDAGKELLRHRVQTPGESYQATVERIGELVEEAETQLGMTGSVGVGMPGSISPATGLIKNANSTNLIGHRLDKDLEARLRRPVRLQNDANCFVLSEAVDGSAAGSEVVFGVIVGTGTGGGIVVNQQVLSGPNAIAGEWGHNPLPWPQPDELPGPECYCGRRGCVETFLSGPAFERDFVETGNAPLTAPEIVQLAACGNANADACLTRYEHRMARSLAFVINILDPDCIVLGGGMSNVDRLYANVPELWPGLVFSDTIRTRLIAPAHGDASGVRGAALLW